MEERPTIEDLNSALREFSPLTVWRAGLVTGSIVHFEIGDQIWHEAFRDGFQPGGNCYLSLNSDDWCLTKNDGLLVSSEDVTRELFEAEIAAMFPGAALNGFRAIRPELIRIEFSGGLAFDCHVPDDAELRHEDLIHLHLPDGRIFCFRPSDGFYLTDETDTTLAMHWAARQTKK